MAQRAKPLSEMVEEMLRTEGPLRHHSYPPPLAPGGTFDISADKIVPYLTRSLIDPPGRAGKQAHMSMTTKAYEVVLADSTSRIVEADDVEETSTRIQFLGPVVGYSDYSGKQEVVVSYREADVVSYRLVPVPEQDEQAEGKHLYRLSYNDGTSQEVRGDYVLHGAGGVDKPGRYTIVTAQKRGKERLEFIAPDSRVASIQRVTEGDADVPTQAPSVEDEPLPVKG